MAKDKAGGSVSEYQSCFFQLNPSGLFFLNEKQILWNLKACCY